MAIVFHERAIVFSDTFQSNVRPFKNNRISTCSATHFGYEVTIRRGHAKRKISFSNQAVFYATLLV